MLQAASAAEGFADRPFGELLAVTHFHVGRVAHPGEVLREEFLPEYGLTAARLAAALGVSRQSVHELLCETRALSPKMALRLARSFGNSEAFWLNLQRAVDLYEAHAVIGNEVRRSDPLRLS